MVLIKKINFENTMSVATALLTGSSVSRETIQKRLLICQECDRVALKNGQMHCGICGCKLAGDTGLFNLARYKETKKYGCKHPEGSKWRGIDD